MTIEIHKPELEALIRERMKLGGFQNVEDALLQALKTAPPADTELAPTAKNRTGAELIVAMQSSPFREIEIEPVRSQMPVRDAAL